MDDADRAAPEIERSEQEAQRLRRPAGPVATGRCLHCDEILDDVRRWCDSGCRDQWEALTRQRRSL